MAVSVNARSSYLGSSEKQAVLSLRTTGRECGNLLDIQGIATSPEGRLAMTMIAYRRISCIHE